MASLMRRLPCGSIARRARLGEAPVASVAAACGFSSQIYFSDLFRRRYGVAPGVWRKSHRR